MQIRIQDIIGVGIASLLLLPVIFVVILFATGTARLEVGVKSEAQENLMGYLERLNPEQQSSDLEQSKLFEANQLKAQELAMREESVRKEIARLEKLKAEHARIREEVDGDRKRIEDLVEQSQRLSDQKVQELAEIYGAMKPVEAAPILLNLDDNSIARIINRVPEVRSQARLMAALGAISTDRAAKISRILGWKKGEL